MAAQVPWNSAGRSPCCCDCDCSLESLYELNVIPYPTNLPQGQTKTYDSWTGARTGTNGASQWPNGEGLEHYEITESDYFALCGGGFLTMTADQWAVSGTSSALVGEGAYPWCTGELVESTPFTVAKTGSNTTTYDLGKRNSEDTHRCAHSTNEARSTEENRSGLFTAGWPDLIVQQGVGWPSLGYTLYWHGGDDDVRPESEPKYSIKPSLSGSISATYVPGPGVGTGMQVQFQHVSWSQAKLNDVQGIFPDAARNSGVSYGSTPIDFSVNGTSISVKGMRVLYRTTFDVMVASCGGGIPRMKAWSGNGLLSASYSSSAP